MKKTHKNIHYLRAKQDDELFDLEAALRRLLPVLPSANHTGITQYGMISRIQYRNLEFVLRESTQTQPEFKQGIALYIVQSVENEHMRTMNNNAPSENDAGGSSPPPNGQSFVQKEAYLYINKHHVLFVGNGIIRYDNICSYLNQLNNQTANNSQGKLSKIDCSFKPVANFDKLQLIREHGAKKLHLNASAYQLSVANLASKKTSLLADAFKGIGNLFRKLSEAESTQEEINAAEDIHVCLALNLEGNTRAIQQAQDFMREQAEAVAEEMNDGFFIETQRGEKISPNDVKLFKRITVKKFEQTNALGQNEAFDEIRNYFNELLNSRLIEL